MLRHEFEVLSGKLIRGDITPMVYELVKDSPFIMDLLEYSSVREETEDVAETRVSGHANEYGGARLDIKDWIANEVQPITVQRYAKHSSKR